MEKAVRKAPKKGQRDLVERYCPYTGDNVIMYRSAGKEPETFECLRRDECEGAVHYKCR